MQNSIYIYDHIYVYIYIYVGVGFVKQTFGPFWTLQWYPELWSTNLSNALPDRPAPQKCHYLRHPLLNVPKFLFNIFTQETLQAAKKEH